MVATSIYLLVSPVIIHWMLRISMNKELKWKIKRKWPTMKYSDTSANEDNSFRDHIR